MEIAIGILIVVIVILGWLLLLIRKDEGKTEAQLERMEKEEAVKEIISDKLKKIDTMRINASNADKLRKRQYRD